MITEIDLPNDRFENTKLVNLKQKNFIFGKNGTGKSTITKLIEEQYSKSYDIRIFQGLDSIAVNSELDAISLGTKNADLQPEIEEITTQIKMLENEIRERDFPNLYSSFIDIKNKYNKSKDIYRKLCTRGASKLKNEYTYLFGPNYDSRKLQLDIPQRMRLEESSIQNLLTTFYQKKLPSTSMVDYRFENINKFIEATNSILEYEIAKVTLIEFMSLDVQNWVREGIHFHKNEQKCAFCGNILSEERLNHLEEFFDENIKKFEKRIVIALDIIGEYKNKVNSFKEIDEQLFYPQIKEKIKALNITLLEYINSTNQILDFLSEKLYERKIDIFNVKERIYVNPSINMDKFIDEYKTICDLNNKISSNLIKEKDLARLKLKYHYVAEVLENESYEEIIKEGSKLKEKYNEVLKEFEEKNNILKKMYFERTKLINLSVDETIAAESINKCLKSIGNQSFSLNLVKSNQKGQYAINDLNGNRRSVSTLSTGEKNIVGFLWFITDLANTKKNSGKNRIIVFDDPMNSNDDNTQYLIIMKLQHLLKNLGSEDQIFILTHNIHFYLNCRYKWWNGSNRANYSKSTIHLYKAGQKTQYKFISSSEDDLHTSYSLLWKELKWLYSRHKPDYMLNPIRRILENFINFNNLSSEEFYKNNLEAEKLFNVNSHSAFDFENFSSDPNGKSEEELIEILKNIFIDNNAENHFIVNWEK
ncbi:AAA family ATPase [Streptococcus uberis]|uniref:AAA family ATPase n=4 Tax=Streptococcus uberis TaxID=1349 RepID=UPI001FF44D46|nr:AAA family ATPase [Streptococcus uberis]MCK1225911.1 AAA family ATPase [Streptococcus uberis]